MVVGNAGRTAAAAGLETHMTRRRDKPPPSPRAAPATAQPRDTSRTAVRRWRQRNVRRLVRAGGAAGPVLLRMARRRRARSEHDRPLVACCKRAAGRQRRWRRRSGHWRERAAVPRLKEGHYVRLGPIQDGNRFQSTGHEHNRRNCYSRLFLRQSTGLVLRRKKNRFRWEQGRRCTRAALRRTRARGTT